MDYRKRILLIVPYNRGTIGLCSLNIYKALLCRKDINVKCVIIHRFKNGYKEFEECKCCVEGSFKGLDNILAFVKELKWMKRIKSEFRPDISISTLFSCSNLSILSGGKDLKIGIFHSPHTQVRASGKLKYFITLLTYRYLYPKLDRLYCVTEGVKTSIISTFKSIDEKKVEVVHNIHDKENIVKKSYEELSSEEDKIFKNPVILYCGRLDRNKAPERLLKAFIEAKGLPASTQLVYIGDDVDHMKTELEDISHEYGVENRVHILGRKDNPYKYMKRARLCSSCSYSEGLPGVLIESLILRTPIVTTNSTLGVWEILSCQNMYDSKMEGIYETESGIISSNLYADFKTEANKKIDIQNLAKSLEIIFSSKFNNVPFAFEKYILAEELAEKYIK